MTGAQSLEQRVDALCHGMGRQPPRFGHSRGQQADAPDQHQLVSLLGDKGITEHSAEVFHERQCGREIVWNTDRIDEIGTHLQAPPTLETSMAGCARVGAFSMPRNLKGESFQAFSGGYPHLSHVLVDLPLRQNPEMEQAA